MRRVIVEVILWLVSLACSVAWVLDVFLIMISSGSPNYTGSGLSKAEIASRMHSVHVAFFLLYLLPAVCLVDWICLWFVRSRATSELPASPASDARHLWYATKTTTENVTSDLVTVGNYYDRISAEIAKSVLDADGIESYVSADDMGGMRPSLLTGSGGAWLVVRAEDAERALGLLQNAPEQTSAIDKD